MADRPYVAQLRQYIDSVNASRGINWKEAFRNAGDPAATENWLYSTYGMDRNEARTYARALAAMRASETSGNDVGVGGSPQQVLESIKGAQPQAPEAPQQDPNEVERQNLTKWMTEFTQSLGRPLDMNDPVFASLSKLGAARASMGVGASGVRVGRGGIGELGIQQGAMNAALPYAQQRQQMLQQGLNALDQRDRGIESLRQNAYGLDLQRQQMQNNVTQQMYGQQADSAGGTGGVVGGALGALAGIGATIATGGAAAGAIPGLIAGGSQIGAGLGQQSVQRPQFAAPRPYGSFGRGNGY